MRQILLDNVQMFANYYTVPESFEGYQFLSYKDMFQNLDQRIKSLGDFLDLKIDQTRYESWLLIYQEWQDRNQGFLEKFLNEPVQVDKRTQSLVSKELLKWKLGLCHPI